MLGYVPLYVLGAAPKAHLLTTDELKSLVANESAYVSWQGSKIHANLEWVRYIDRKVENGMKTRLAGLDLSGRSVLCIGARAGGEVRAFTSLGAFAVGIDLEPESSSEFVLKGNAMKLQFASGSVDLIFTNVVDHIPSLEQFAQEVARVLKRDGVFFADVHAQTRSEDQWAVRDTGTAEFYKALASAMNRTGAMTVCDSPPPGAIIRPERPPPRPGQKHVTHNITWQKVQRAPGHSSGCTGDGIVEALRQLTRRNRAGLPAQEA